MAAGLAGAPLPPLGSGLARAEDAAATSRAREAFTAGLALEEAGKFDEALKRFREVVSVRKTPQVLYHVALCLEKLNQWPEALVGYRQATQLVDQLNDPKNNDVKVTIAQAHSALDNRLPALQLKRGKGARNAVVQVDGQRIDDVRDPLRLMPGKHVIQARARGRDNFRSDPVLAEGQRLTVELVLEDLGDGTAEKEPDIKPDDKASKPPSSGRSAAPFVVMGLGAAALAAGGVFYLLRSSALDDLSRQCAGNICPTTAKATGDRARTMNTLSNVSLGAGAVGLGLGLVLLLTSGGGSDAPPKSARVRLAPDASPALLGARLSGAF